MTVALVSTENQTRVAELLELAIGGLERMYVPKKRLFCNRLRLVNSCISMEGVSHRYTMMSALGLIRAKQAGLDIPISVPQIVDQLLSDRVWVDNIGDLGLLLWLCAACSRSHLVRFHSAFPLQNAMNQYRGANLRSTMELAWFLTGLTCARDTNATQPSCLERVACEAYEMLRKNQGPQALFGHMARLTSVAGLVRGHIGSFADQIYPIIGMAQYASVFGSEDAYSSAEKCARIICQHQGERGQWWWHYDSRTGRVVEQYPVYSVHQHGMAPMALHAVEAAGGANFTSHISKGLNWIDGDNELRCDMKHPPAKVVWRSILETPLAKCRARFRLANTVHSADHLRVLHECRSYELGWLLYGLAQLP